MTKIIFLILLVIGFSLGSFLNVCIYRLPRGESIIWPPSRCIGCGKRLKWYELIPVISFLLLGGRCMHCRQPISWQYPAVEILTGLLFLFLFIHFGWGWTYISNVILCCLLLVAAFVDAGHWMIPDKITVPGILFGFLLSFFNPVITPLQSITGVLIGGGILYLFAVAYRGGMGGGDIKLVAMVGAFQGWGFALLTIFFAALLGSLAGLVLILTGQKGLKSKIQFGIFLGAASVMLVFFGDKLINWYLHLF